MNAENKSKGRFKIEIALPDLAGPWAKSFADKVKYLIKKRASPKHCLFLSGVASTPRLRHSFSDHFSIASNRVTSSAFINVLKKRVLL